MRSFCLFIIVLIGSSSLAQTHSSIRTGRPGQAIGPFVAGTGVFQVQSGVDVSRSKENVKTETVLSNTVLRYGFSESFEISGVFNYQSDDLGQTTRQGISDAQLGFRFNAIDKPDGFVPALGIQARFRSTSVSREYKSENVAPVLLLAFQHKLSEPLVLTNNLGLSYDGKDAEPTHIFVTNLSFPLTGAWGGFVEVYGNERNGRNNHFADTGLSYLLNNDLQFDFSTGWGKNHKKTDAFVSIGVSWRTHWLRSRVM